jgi:hypothetical protein
MALGAPLAPAQEAAPVDLTASIQQARVHIRDNEFDAAIDVLQGLFELAESDVERLRDVYLLLIKSYVFGGNYHALQAQGRATSELFYARAEELVRECFAIYPLRHTVALPAEEYPPEMHELMDRVRREVFGGLTVTSVEPKDAELVLDGRMLSLGEDGTIRETNLAVGQHFLVLRRDGYENQAETLVISPASTLERTFTLRKRKGWMWKLTRIGAPLVAVVTAVAVIVGSGGEDTSEQPLPGPPPPPTE